ncbi:MAG: DnaA regulatory inactivator Hda [Xanthomonadaceae bacterium]|nr:DnaA regulatory inactivator Hda [Xanthomonadaceae bacterium]MDE2084843.1 DnaA regulatory inactivator Hda [Xanthomonadaceae bacterium]MDE2256589.1 DnaA regulatory inactivator Hda [Xanthomonadaceae bacterium]
MNAQLPLLLRWPAQQRFETFVSGANGVVLALLREAATINAAAWVFLGGPAGSGKTHLLLAACAAASAAGRSAQYVPLRGADGDRAGSIRALGGSELLALDDVDAIAGDAGAEHALFDLYNRCFVAKSTLLFSASAPLARIGLALPDLVSRLSACAQARLTPLDDAARRDWLRERARTRGLALDDAVLDWLFAHHARDLGSLAALLERVDRAALAAQRRVTVAFLRDLLGGGA